MVDGSSHTEASTSLPSAETSPLNRRDLTIFKQVEDLLIVDLEKASLIFDTWILVLKQMQKGPRKDAILIWEARIWLSSALHEVILATKDWVGLACTCLTIGEDSAVNPQGERVYEAPHMVEYLVLRGMLR